MPVHYIDNDLIVARYLKPSERKYKPVLSKLLRSRFGTGEQTTATVTEALWFAFEWYCDLFMELISSQQEVAFYQSLFGLHEFSSKLHSITPNKSPVPHLMSDADFAVYRRSLKLCLEQACDLKLIRNKQYPTPAYLKRKEGIIDELLFAGDKIYEVIESLSLQHLIEDSVDLHFKENGDYYFHNKHHYGRVMFEINKESGDHLSHAVIGKNELSDFKEAINTCLKVDFDQGIGTILAMQENNEKHGGKMAMEEWYAYPSNFAALFDVDYADAARFYQGLTLSKTNKMTLREAVQKPHKLNKYLYRPFLIWNVDGVDRTIVGLSIIQESLVSLYGNAIAWKKYPEEWESPCFKDYVNRKAHYNDKILEDEAERMLVQEHILYDRNLTFLSKWNKQNLGIDHEECGEIDFLFIVGTVLYLADSKHLLSRYDMSSYRNDYAAFETNKKAYNKTAAKKLMYLHAHLPAIEEHFQVKLNDPLFRLEISAVEAIFIVNTPTFMMYNNTYRLYTLRDFERLLKGTFEDKVYTVPLVEGKPETIAIRYPYFKKPSYTVFDRDVG
ncbi:hypothetical protein [Mucilaginibacter sp.]|uniref:hypothetical protein n=1 Tax=Mucilaginibacter sp. TaxID=1882438 RepID=UPI002609D2C7|nr:hypothetical protein [Mucilaginibacter sp.]MDB5128335.1 hypothetical protein [Mucilaginibacter sp.]